MESIKTLVWRPLNFLKSLIYDSRTTTNQSTPTYELRTEEQRTPELLDSLNLSSRVSNCLWKANIRSIETLASMSDDSLLNIQGFGDKALAEVKERLASYDSSNENTRPAASEVE